MNKTELLAKLQSEMRHEANSKHALRLKTKAEAECRFQSKLREAHVWGLNQASLDPIDETTKVVMDCHSKVINRIPSTAEVGKLLANPDKLAREFLNPFEVDFLEHFAERQDHLDEDEAHALQIKYFEEDFDSNHLSNMYQ